jgi:hypothetical protein
MDERRRGRDGERKRMDESTIERLLKESETKEETLEDAIFRKAFPHFKHIGERF